MHYKKNLFYKRFTLLINLLTFCDSRTIVLQVSDQNLLDCWEYSMKKISRYGNFFKEFADSDYIKK